MGKWDESNPWDLYIGYRFQVDNKRIELTEKTGEYPSLEREISEKLENLIWFLGTLLNDGMEVKVDIWEHLDCYYWDYHSRIPSKIKKKSRQQIQQILNCMQKFYERRYKP